MEISKNSDFINVELAGRILINRFRHQFNLSNIIENTIVVEYLPYSITTLKVVCSGCTKQLFLAYNSKTKKYEFGTSDYKDSFCCNGILTIANVHKELIVCGNHLLCGRYLSMI